MDFLLDKVEYSAAQFHEEFGHRLPVMAKVTQGFLGEITQETFDIDQVIRIHTESRQKRVVMETRQAGTQQSFSIPVTYHAKFCIVNKYGKVGKELSLAEITSVVKFPVMVQFAKKEAITVGNRHTSTSHFPKMQLVKSFDEMYLLGNVVNDGAFTEPVVPIPLYLSRMRISQIVGIRGQEKVKFKYLLDRFSDFADKVTYDREFGNKEIAVYGPHTIPKDAVYQYVEPQAYTRLDTLLKQHGHAGQSGRYEPLQENSDRYEPLRHTDAAGQANDNVYEEIKPHQAAGQHTRETKPPKHTPTQTQKTEKVDLSGLPDRTSPIAPRKPMKPSTTKQDAARASVQPPALPQRNTIPRANMPNYDSQTQQVASVPYANVIPRGNIRPTVNVGNTPKEVETIPDVTSIADDDGIVVAEGVEKPVKPDIQPASDKIHVSGLRIEEVCEWMKYLKLDKYCEQFREQMIDGDMLRELDKDILSSEFGLSPIESRRLVKFAKQGHIPM